MHKYKNITYLGYYLPPNLAPNREMHLAGNGKMDYILYALNKICPSINIISANVVAKGGYTSGATIVVKEGMNLTLVPGFGGKNFFSRIIRKTLWGASLFCKIARLNSESVLIAYHSISYANLLRFAKKIFRFKLILEVEEIYQDVKSLDIISQRAEYSVITSADAFIFPTILLNQKLNISGKPYALCCGNYKTAHRHGNGNTRNNDGKIHVVYAGTFDASKGGAMAAIESAKFLSEKYVLHLLGFGSNDEIELIKNKIDITNKITASTVVFEGSKTGQEFESFLQQCDIGLSTQNPAAKFNDTSFPSKILTYLANGLKVVSVNIPAVSQSPVSQNVYYYNEQTPQEIAHAITQVSETETEHSDALLSRLDQQFQYELKKLIDI